MTSDELLFSMLKIPSGYKEILKSVRQGLIKSNQQNIADNFSKEKKSLKLFEWPAIISDSNINSKAFLVNQTTLFSQGMYYGETAKTAPLDVKPLLYHYAENSLFAFFVYSLSTYTQPHASSHGLNIKWSENIDEIEVVFNSTGFFSRILDTYSLCKARTHLSILELDSSSNGFKPTSSKYSILKQPSIPLLDIIQLREQLGEQEDGYFYDIIDFVLLFFASSLARYRPYLWIELMRGEVGKQYIWFNQCFERFDIFRYRLLKSLIDIHKTGNLGGCQLQHIDHVTRQQMM